MRITLTLATFAAGLSLAACQKQAAAPVANDVATTSSSPAPASTPEPTGTPAAPPAQLPVIASQPGPKGSTFTLNKMQVVGNVMTVQLTATDGSCCSYLKLDEIAVIDDASTRRIAVLKDDTGRWMAAPLTTDGKELRVFDNSGKPQIVWLKFPAPPPESKTMSLTIPQVGPFDGVPIQR